MSGLEMPLRRLSIVRDNLRDARDLLAKHESKEVRLAKVEVIATLSNGETIPLCVANAIAAHISENAHAFLAMAETRLEAHFAAAAVTAETQAEDLLREIREVKMAHKL